MIQVNISGSNNFYLLPENWEEVTPAQFAAIIPILESHTENDLAGAKLKILQRLLNAPNAVFYGLYAIDKFKQQNQIDAISKWLGKQYAEELIPVIDYIFTPGAFFKNLVPEFTHNKTIYLGPKDGFENATIGEIEEADQFYRLYLAGEDRSHLIKMIAILWRPKIMEKDPSLKRNIESRAPLDLDQLNIAAEILTSLPDHTVKSIRIVYERIMKWYATNEQYQSLFSSSGEENAPVEYKTWSKIVRAMAGEKLGTIEQVRTMRFYEVLDQIKFANQEAEDASKNNKP